MFFYQLGIYEVTEVTEMCCKEFKTKKIQNIVLITLKKGD